MATVDYASVAREVAEALLEVGQQGKVTRISAPDPVEGGDPMPVDYPATLIPMGQKQMYLDGSTILSTVTEIYISSSGLAIVPQVGDYVSTADGRAFHLVAGDPNNFDGVTNVVFIVQGETAS